MKTKSFAVLLGFVVLFASCSVLGDIEDLRAKVTSKKSFSVRIMGDKWETAILTADVTASSGIGTPSYKWLRRTSPTVTPTEISGANASTYTVGPSDRNMYISVIVEYSLLDDVVESAQVKIHPGIAIKDIDGQYGLNNIRSGLSGSYILLDNLTLSSNWNPIGITTSFSGTFDGNGHTITIGNSIVALNIASSVDAAGLFGAIGSSGTVKNLRLVATATPSISTSSSNVFYTGAVAGENRGTIMNVSSTVPFSTTSGTFRTGGIVGRNYGTIKNCYNGGTINVSVSNTTGAYGGGIAAMLILGGKITNCWSSGNVTAKNTSTTPDQGGHAGGIFGSYGTTGGSGDTEVKGNVALCSTVTSNDQNSRGRIWGNGSLGSGTLTEHNFGFDDMDLVPYYGVTGSPKLGTNVSTALASTQGWWTGTAGWTTVYNSKAAAQAALAAASDPDTVSPWVWNGTRPVLWFTL